MHHWYKYLFYVCPQFLSGDEVNELLDEEVIPCIWPRSVKVVGGTVVETKGAKKSVPAAKGKGKK